MSPCAVRLMQVYQPSGPKAMQDGMIEVKERHAFVVFFKTDESGFVPVGQVKQDRPIDQNPTPTLRFILSYIARQTLNACSRRQKK